MKSKMRQLHNNICCLKNKTFFYGPDLELIEKLDSQSPSCINTVAGKYREVDPKNIVMLCNITDPETILQYEAKTDPFQGKFKCRVEGYLTLPFYLYYEDESILYSMLKDYDIKILCDIFRIVIIVGDKALNEFFKYLDVLYPNVIIEGVYGSGAPVSNIAGGKDNTPEGRNSQSLDHSITKRIEILFHKYYTYMMQMTEECKKYYQENKNAILNSITNRTAVITVLKNIYEPIKFQGFYKQLKAYCDKRGYRMLLTYERDTIFRTNEMIHIYQEKPDIVLQINKSRDGKNYQGESLNIQELTNLVYINWLQDIHPDFLNKNYFSNLTKNDYVFSLFDKHYLDKYGCKDHNVICGGIMSVDENVFKKHELSKEDHQKYDCDISFIGTVMTEEEISYYIFDALNGFLNLDQIDRVMDIVIRIIEQMYDNKTGKYNVDGHLLENYTSLLADEFQCNNDMYMQIFRALCVVRYNTMRKFIMVQLGKLKKYKINLYGALDVGIEGVSYGGYISDSVELSKALQCSAITMQINPDATMNQRVIEGILSGTLAMILKMAPPFDISSADNYLKPEEGICYFHSKQEMIHNIDYYLNHQEECKRIVDRGREVVLSTLTNTRIFDHLFSELNTKMKEAEGLNM